MKLVSALFLLMTIIVSCKKDKLEGDKEILVGKWNWINTQSISNSCDADSLWNFVMFDSATADKTYSLEFLSKGKVIFAHNDGTIWNDRIVFESFTPLTEAPYQYEFVIRLDNRKNDPFTGLVGADSLRIPDFPFDTEVDCEARWNHFVKE